MFGRSLFPVATDPPFVPTTQFCRNMLYPCLSRIEDEGIVLEGDAMRLAGGAFVSIALTSVGLLVAQKSLGGFVGLRTLLFFHGTFAMPVTESSDNRSSTVVSIHRTDAWIAHYQPPWGCPSWGLELSISTPLKLPTAAPFSVAL